MAPYLRDEETETQKETMTWVFHNEVWPSSLVSITDLFYFPIFRKLKF